MRLSRKPLAKKCIFALITIVFIVGSFLPYTVGQNAVVHAENESDNRPDYFTTDTFIEPYYHQVLEEWKEEGKDYGKDNIDLKAIDYSAVSEEGAVKTGSYRGKDNVILLENTNTWIEYEVNVNQSGLYSFAVEYLPLAQEDGGSRQSPIIGVQVNGEFPYREARSIELRRDFKDRDPQFDDEGHQIRSLIEEITDWKEEPIREPGVSVSPLLFYLDKGKNTIRLQLMRDKVAISSLSVFVPEELPTYEEVKASFSGEKTGEVIEFEAEEFTSKNTTSIQVQYDRDPLTTPESLLKIRFNTIGGSSWYNGGQSVTWTFNVPKSGEYKIGFRGLNNVRKNLVSFRTLYIDGEIPYKEMEHVRIPYATGWQGVVISNEEGEPYTFYLEEGEHTITLEATYEPFAPIIVKIDEISNKIKGVTQEIRTASGNRVDEWRVWNVEKEIPGLIEALEEMRTDLKALAELTNEINGLRSNVSQSFESVVRDIDELLKKPNEIPNNQIRISSLQEKVDAQRTELTNNPLQIDKFYITPADEEFPRMKSNFFEKVKGTISSLIYSFQDRNQLREQKDEELNVWMMWGRDYADELQQLADQYFTPVHGIKVNVNLIQDQNLLILAKAAGIMPDVALGVPSGMPFEMAIRGAAKDLSTLPGADELIAQYAPGSILPYYYDGGIYGIPETINFKILFYRKDILQQLGLEVPNTWEDVYDMIPTLLQNNYNFYADPGDFSYMLFQNGVELYTEDGLASGLDKGFAAFEEWTNLFNLHGMDAQVASFYQHFRNGTMPIGISDFNQYMQLLVAAPEILDLWGVAPIPGHVNEEGEIVRWAGGTGMNTTSIMMFNDTPEEKQELAWEFIKWYTSTEIQTEYGLNLEQFRGEQFRWNSANIAAFAAMPWRQQDLQAILEQWRWVKDIPNVPGGYMTTRQLGFAWNLTVLEGQNPRVELEKAIKEINRELKRKQLEFGLIDEEGNVLHPLKMLIVDEPWEGVDEYVQ